MLRKVQHTCYSSIMYGGYFDVKRAFRRAEISESIVDRGQASTQLQAIKRLEL